MIKTSFLTTLAAAALLLPSLAQASEMTVALTADILGTQPGSNRDDNTDGVMLNIVEGLVGYGEGGTVVPILAKSVDLSEDGLTYTFAMREGVTFHNGDPVTSADFLWSWDLYTKPETEWRCLPEVDGTNGLSVTSVEAPDDMTVVIKVDTPSALFLDTLARTDCWMTAVLSKQSVAADGSWNAPVGTGPYMLGEWTKGQSVVLEKFADYKSPDGDGFDGYAGDKTPNIDTVTLTVVPDAATAKTALLSGAIDVGQALTADVPELESADNVVLLTPSDASKHAILFQTSKGIFADAKLRQAVAAALDLEELVNLASDGLSNPSNSAVFRTSSYYDDTQKKMFESDPEKARQLIEEAVYNGEAIKLVANQRAPMPSYPVALGTQQMMQAVGLNVEIEIVEWGTALDLYRAGDYEMMSFSYSSRLDPALSFEQFSGDKTAEPRKIWDNPKALELIARSKIVSDPAERQQIFDELHEMMLADTPLIFLFNGITVWAHNARLENFKPWEGKPRLWGVRVKQ